MLQWGVDWVWGAQILTVGELALMEVPEYIGLDGVEAGGPGLLEERRPHRRGGTRVVDAPGQQRRRHVVEPNLKGEGKASAR